jgi:uncharacterized membrane protein YphA (DoxX/SURF4 family)
MKNKKQIHQFLQNKRFQLALRLALGLLFLVAGLAKVLDMPAFVRAIGQYDFVPLHWEAPLATLIAYGEVTLGLMLLLDFYRRFALAAGSILILLFSAVSLYQYLQTGSAADCGCFGKLLARQNNWQLFVENAVIFAALLVGWKFSGEAKKVPQQNVMVEPTSENN